MPAPNEAQLGGGEANMMRGTEAGAWTWGSRGRGHPLGRVALFIVVALVANLLQGILVMLVLRRVGASPQFPLPSADFGAGEPMGDILIAAVTFLPIALGLVYLFQVRLDRVPWFELWRPAGTGFLGGMLRGAVGGWLVLVVTGLVVWLGGAVDSVDRGELLDQGLVRMVLVVAAYVVGFFCQSGVEEIIFRGYIFRRLGRWRGGAVAVVGSAALFALAHGLNPSGGALALINTFLMGLLLGLVRSRYCLWTALGVHGGWNLLMALSGVPLSGFPLPGLASVNLSASTVWSGGAYGVEASVAVTVVVTLATLGIFRAPAGRVLSRGWWGRPPAHAPLHPESSPG